MKILFFAAFAFFALFGPSARAQDITAVVNGQVISDYDVGQRQKLLAISGNGGSRTTAMQELIDERLKLQEAEKLNVAITDTQVDKAFESVAQRSKLSGVEFTKALASRGIDAKTLKNRLRAELGWQGVIRQKARVVMNIRDQDVIDGIKKKGQDPDTIKSYEFVVMQAIVFAPKDTSAGAAAQRANAFRSSVKNCDMARQKAIGMKDTAVKEPVRRNGNELNGAMRGMLEKTPVGGTTPVQQTDKGFEFMVVCDKKPVSGADGAKAEMKNELMMKEVTQASERLLREVKEKSTIDIRKK
ncbi:MAG: SurA N-terminal domain-containing protein [Pseudomonadota bacterium]